MKRLLIALMCILLVFCYMPVMAFADGAEGETSVSDGTHIYVSSGGSDDSGNGTQEKPYATLAKAAQVVNDGTGENFTVHVMSDLTSEKCARFYNKNVTIVGEGTTAPVVTRGDNFETLDDNARSWYNPAMIEIQTSEAPASLTLKNIIFDDAGKHMGTVFAQAISGEGNKDNTKYVQDAIVASNATQECTITLDEGAELRNYGGMSAVRVTDKAGLVMKSGSKIEDTAISERKSGKSAIWLQGGSFIMNEGAQITKIAGLNVIYADGTTDITTEITINGEISYNDTKGNHILQTDSNTNTNIGASGNIHHNMVHYGAVYLNDKNEHLTIYGKVNNNYSDDRGGGVVVSNNGDVNKNVIVYPGAEICNNISKKTGGGIMVSCGTLTMKGGKISGNISKEEGGGVYVRKGGHFTMEDGEISDNKSASFGGGIAFTASDYSGWAPYADLKGGSIINNAMNAEVKFDLLNSTAEGGESNDLAIASDEYGKADRFLSVGSKIKIANNKVYFANEGKDITFDADSLESKLGNASPGSVSYLSADATAKGWSSPLATFWTQRGGAATMTVGGLNDKINSGLPVYAMALPVGEDGNPAVLAERAVPTSSKTSVYAADVTESGITFTVPEGNDNGYAIALVQPTADFGNVVITTAKSQIDKNKDKTAEGTYEIPYTATYNMSKNLEEIIKTGIGSISDEKCKFTFTVELDKRLTAKSGAGDYKFTSPIFELEKFTLTNNGSTVTAECKLKDDWKEHIGELSEKPMVIIGTGVLAEKDFTVGDTINTTGHIEVSISTDSTDSVGNLRSIYVPGNVCRTLMVEETAPEGPIGPTVTFYLIKATAGEGGAIAPSGYVSVLEGTDKTFVITPAEGYEIKDVLVDGTSVGAVSEYTFNKVYKNHTIDVTFQEKKEEPTNPEKPGKPDKPAKPEKPNKPLPGDKELANDKTNTGTNVPKTGDTGMNAMVLNLMLLSISAMAGAVLCIRRKITKR